MKGEHDARQSVGRADSKYDIKAPIIRLDDRHCVYLAQRLKQIR